jgi:hypothetical protein
MRVAAAAAGANEAEEGAPDELRQLRQRRLGTGSFVPVSKYLCTSTQGN